jgi:hypothetical protein
MRRLPYWGMSKSHAGRRAQCRLGAQREDPTGRSSETARFASKAVAPVAITLAAGLDDNRESRKAEPSCSFSSQARVWRRSSETPLLAQEAAPRDTAPCLEPLRAVDITLVAAR